MSTHLSDSDSSSVRVRATSALESKATGGNDVEKARSGEVSVQSSVVIDTTQETDAQTPAQIQGLLSRLSTTTSQIDDYSRRQSEKISQAASDRIQSIIRDTQQQQDALLRDASQRSQEIESEYSAKLKAFLQELDASKAGNLASLEKDLNFRQEQLLNNARAEIDGVVSAATQAKIAAMQHASASVARDVDQLTDQVRQLGEEEVERRMNSTTTTLITTTTHTENAASSTEHRKEEDISHKSSKVEMKTQERGVREEKQAEAEDMATRANIARI